MCVLAVCLMVIVLGINFVVVGVGGSDLISEKVDGKDIFKLFAATANDRTIYNYNLFKYPNVEVYANPSDFERIIIK